MNDGSAEVLGPPTGAGFGDPDELIRDLPGIDGLER